MHQPILDEYGAWSGAPVCLSLNSAPKLLLFVFTATHVSVRTVLLSLVAALRECGLDRSDLDNTQIVVGELLNNVVEHAYDMSHKGNVSLTIQVIRSGLRIVCKDDGRPMPDLALPKPRNPAQLPQYHVEHEGGFGWHLIRALVENVSYRREGESNIVQITLPLSEPVFQKIR